MATASLINIFNERRKFLLNQLTENPEINTAANSVKSFVDSLFIEYRQREKDAHCFQMSVILSDCIKSGTQTLLAARNTTIWKTNSRTTAESNDSFSNKKKSNLKRWLLIIRLTMILGLCMWIYTTFTGTFERGVVIGIFVLILITQIVEAIYAAREQSRKNGLLSQLAQRDITKDLRVDIKVEPEIIISALRETIIWADKLLEQERLPEPILTQELPDFIINYFQEISSAHLTRNTDYMAHLSKDVESLLLPFGITVITSYEGANRSRFDTLPSLKKSQTEPKISKVALVKGDEVIRRGVIIIPNQQIK